jgi:hypothetical protein
MSAMFFSPLILLFLMLIDAIGRLFGYSRRSSRDA